MIDLHMHTTASDGRCTPAQLVDEAAKSGLTVMAVTDHDTMAATDEVVALARSRDIDAINGIEITAVENGLDVHVLGYFCDISSERLAAFLLRQRQGRLDRVRAIIERLVDLGMPIDIQPPIVEAVRNEGYALGRPHIARALVAAGHVVDVKEAFDRWLAYGCPAFVSRAGYSVRAVVEVIHEAGGLASLAHPGVTRVDQWIPMLRDHGLDALEVYHPGHDAKAVARYEELATRYGFLMTAGSDYHGDPAHGRTLGMVTLPESDWQRFRAGR